MSRYAFIDSLRGLAACAVVVFHLNELGTFPSSLYQTIVKHGDLGVQVFFVISGFAVYFSLLRSRSSGAFLVKRFWRIYPPYLASVALTLALVVARKAMTDVNDLTVLPQTVWGWLATLTLTTKPVTSTPVVNWVYWSLSYEAAFYLVLSLGSRKPKMRPLLLVVPSALALTGAASKILLLNMWSYFALGAAIAAWRAREGWWPLLPASLCLLDFAANNGLIQSSAGVATGLCLLACTSRSASWLNKEPLLSKAGAWSYSLYLTHVPIGCWAGIGAIDPWPRPLSASDFFVHLVVDLGLLTFCCADALLFYRLVEVPSQRKSSFEEPHTRGSMPKSI